METLKLYTVAWSKHCVSAEELLDEAEISYTRVNLDRWELVDAVPRDIGIQKLPALRVNGTCYEGLSGISEFIKKAK